MSSQPPHASQRNNERVADTQYLRGEKYGLSLSVIEVRQRNKPQN